MGPRDLPQREGQQGKGETEDKLDVGSREERAWFLMEDQGAAYQEHQHKAP